MVYGRKLMRNARRRRGFEAERELVRKLWSKGFAVIRAPASGARTRLAAYPDIVAIFRGRIYAIEVKYRRDESPIYIDKVQLEKLLEFSRRASATPLIAVKRPNKGWKFIPASLVKRTNSGSIKIDDEVLDKGMSLDEFVAMATSVDIKKFINDAG